jgi:signal transduction histidine kinase
MHNSGNSPLSLSFSYHPEIWPALITLFLIIYLGSYSWQRRNIPAAKPFIVACVLSGFWTIGVILEILASQYTGKVFWIRFQAIWHLPAVTAITCFVLQYAGLGRFLNRRIYVLLSIVPVLGAVVMVTNDFHHLMWAGFPTNVHVSISAGGMYWFFISYGYLLSIINFAVLLWLAVSSPGQRLPVAIILICQVIARIGYGVDKIYPELIGPGERVLVVVGVMTAAYALAFLRFHAIDPVAAARRAVFDQMGEGLYVLDMQNRIVYTNPMAAAIAGVPDHGLRQRQLAEVLPIDACLLNQMESQKIGQTDLTLSKDDSAKRYNLLLTPLRGRKDEVIGKMLLMRDVTEHWRAQDRIIEQQRTVAKLQEREHLARELHDGIGQILGYVSIQAQTALKWMQNGNADKAGSVLGRIAEVAKDAHADIRESILTLRVGSEKKKSFTESLKNYLGRFQANFGIRTELSIPPNIDEGTFDPALEAQLIRVIQEALTNSRKHSGAQTLKVSVELNTSKALITVTDDGKGIDASQIDRSNGSHFGLVFMRERMAEIGGSLTIVSVPNGGTTLKLEAPIRVKGDKSQ